MKKINMKAAFMLGLIGVLLAIDSFFGNIGTDAYVAASFFPMFYRDPGGGEGGGAPEWKADTVYKTQDSAVSALTERGLTIRSADQEKEFLTNATATAVSEGRKEERKTFLGGIDSALKELSGVEREHTMKTTDYIKDIFGKLTGSAKKVSDELAALKESGITGNAAAEEVKSQLDVVKKQLKTQGDEKDVIIAGLKGDRWKDKVSTATAEAMAVISPTLVKVEVNGTDMTQSVINDKIAAFNSKYEAIEHEGTIIYHHRADGTPVIDSQNGNHLSTSSLLAKAFEGMVDKGRNQGGAGGAGAGGGEDKTKLTLPASVNTRIKLNDYLMGDDGNGFKHEGKTLTGTEPVFNKLFNDNRGDLPLR